MDLFLLWLAALLTGGAVSSRGARSSSVFLREKLGRRSDDRRRPLETLDLVEFWEARLFVMGPV
jgi:predicted metalloprotease